LGRLVYVGVRADVLRSERCNQVLERFYPNGRPPLVLDFWYLLLFMSFATVGAWVACRQPGNAIGWIFCYLGLTFPLVGAGEEYALYALVSEPGSLPGEEGLVWLAALLGGPIVLAVFAHVFLLFPEGRLL
jgi:hypothetical protein